MKKVTYFLILFFYCCAANADQLSDQMNAIKAVQDKNDAEARDLAKVQADYARQQENLRQAEIRNAKIQQEKENKAAAARSKELANKAAAQAKLINDERLKDKARLQAQEDEERELDIELKKAKVQEIKALAAAKAARANELLDAELAEKKAGTDVIQSNADANRNVSEGSKQLQTGVGKGAEAEGSKWFR